MAEGAYDPYAFDHDDYVESRTPNLSDSFMEMFREKQNRTILKLTSVLKA